jgi:hypothetical protein
MRSAAAPSCSADLMDPSSRRLTPTCTKTDNEVCDQRSRHGSAYHCSLGLGLQAEGNGALVVVAAAVGERHATTSKGEASKGKSGWKSRSCPLYKIVAGCVGSCAVMVS